MTRGNGQRAVGAVRRKAVRALRRFLAAAITAGGTRTPG
jgi:hypothetical protein